MTIIVLPCDRCKKKPTCSRYKSLINELEKDLRGVRIGNIVFKLEFAVMRIDCDEAE